MLYNVLVWIYGYWFGYVDIYIYWMYVYMDPILVTSEC